MFDANTKSVEILQTLVRQPSLSGQEEAVIQAARAGMESCGFDEIWTDQTGNLVGVLNGKRPGKRVIFDAHLDVVPVTTPEAWKHTPFSGEIENGCVWGRGATDNKGSLSAMIAGISALPREELAGTIYVVGSIGEEKHEGTGLAQVVDALKPDMVVIGEPTDCRLGFGQRGRARLIFRVSGTAGHSSANNQANNSVYGMARLIAALENHPFPSDRWLGEGIQAPIELISNPYPSLSTVPVECRLTVDRRLVLGETEESVLQDYRKSIAGIPGASVEMDVVTYVSYTGKAFTASDFHPAWVTEPESGMVRGCLNALISAGVQTELYPVPYCTNGSYSAGVAGIPNVVFGPGSITQAHAMDEFLAIDQLHAAAKGYQAIARVIGTL